jgi:putative ABC transport system ATP-binding protein
LGRIKDIFMANVIECRGVYKNYMSGKMEVPVLKNVNFLMAEGEYTAIMGPSGSGKSTLMNIIGCLDVPTEGKVLIAGQDIAGLSDNEMSDLRLYKIGFVFQTFQLLSRQSALSNVELPLSYAHVPRKKRREMAMEALKKVGLEDRVNFMPSQLSGGQKQRVAIARAIVNNPRILLADEPTGALDSASGKQVMEIFRQLNREGVSILMITHDREIASHADRIVEIRDGVLREDHGAENRGGVLSEDLGAENRGGVLSEDLGAEKRGGVLSEDLGAENRDGVLSENRVVEERDYDEPGGGDAV